jgi:DegV family protein with EDD domain
MGRVGIVTDSTCDVAPAELERLGVEMVPLTVRFGDETFLDWIELTPDQFYRRLATSQELPKTSQPSPAQFSAAYKKLAESGAEEIVAMTISSGLSGTYDSALLGAKDSPVPVRVVDTKRASQGVALILREAVKTRDAGGDAAAVEARTRQIAGAEELYFVLDTLDYLVKGGRAGKAAGLAAALLNIKPVLRVNADGLVEPFAKVRGRAQAIAAFANHIAEESRRLGRLKAVLLHAAIQGEAEELEAAFAAAGADIELVACGEIGAVIGTYTGPGAVGVAYYPESEA